MWLIIHIIRRVTRRSGNLINYASSILGSPRWPATDKHTNRFTRFLGSFVVWLARIRWEFVEATRVISTGFLWEWNVKNTRAYYFRREINRSYVSRSKILVLVRIRRKMIQWRAGIQKSSRLHCCV